MSDEELRALEREVRAAPNDAALARRFALALERSGNRRAAQRELARLARAGDSSARAELLLPLPPHANVPRFRPCNRSPVATTATARSSRFELNGYPSAIASGERVLLVRASEGVIAIDTTELTERWRVALPKSAPTTVSGTDLLAGVERELVLFDGDTGVEVERARLPGTIVALDAEWDRCAAVLAATSGRLRLLAAIDLGHPFGRVLWKRLDPSERMIDIDHGLGVLRVSDGFVLRRDLRLALDLETGATDASRRHRFERGDHCGSGPPGGGLAIDANGRTYWATLDISGVVGDELTECKVYVGSAQSPFAVLPRLKLARDSTREFSRRVLAVAPASGVVYLLSSASATSRVHNAWTRSNGTDFANVIMLDAASGRLLFDRNIEADFAGEFHTLELVALERAVVVTIATPGSLEVVRLE